MKINSRIRELLDELIDEAQDTSEKEVSDCLNLCGLFRQKGLNKRESWELMIGFLYTKYSKESEHVLCLLASTIIMLEQNKADKESEAEKKSD